MDKKLNQLKKDFFSMIDYINHTNTVSHFDDMEITKYDINFDNDNIFINITITLYDAFDKNYNSINIDFTFIYNNIGLLDIISSDFDFDKIKRQHYPINDLIDDVLIVLFDKVLYDNGYFN